MKTNKKSKDEAAVLNPVDSIVRRIIKSNGKEFTVMLDDRKVLIEFPDGKQFRLTPSWDNSMEINKIDIESSTINITPCVSNVVSIS